MKVSPIKCQSKFARVLPNNLRIPTSLALLKACAVAKLIKLIQAVSSRKALSTALPGWYLLSDRSCSG
jgi:hypothetical protein